MVIRPCGAALGAFVDGVSLATLNAEVFKVLYKAFLQYRVLFFRDQSLSPEQHLALGKRFGELELAHPFFPHLAQHDQVVIIETSLGNPPGESFWHTDMTWQAIPPKCSILHAQYVPPVGGDTLWCDMAAVFADLSNEEQNHLRTLNTIHALHAFEGSRYDAVDANGQSRVAQKSQAYPSIVRPMVTRHPETGDEVLFINEQFTRSVQGWEDAQSQALLDRLFAIARQDRFHVRLKWQAGTVAIWDNRVTQHFAVTDYGDQPRRLHRVTVQGLPD
ncbi:taurine dioxygenase [Marinomonas alcarazii]|uniref:Taurine dioxygenase n=1 Tax=Marinomonas alcarazii TaxID=491949 RepID=A0A318V4C9_9GAMM|nr:TauD/TfdA family dioxygenase [Marinomonas alcarazii]PYF83454.1 taurine dioxygenase [Marinomonas alcarazii]